MLALGYTFCLAPFARKYLHDAEKQREFLSRNMTFFNTHPYLAGWILGGVLKLEINAISDRNISPKLIERYKKQLSSTLAAIGDQMFWGLLKPMSAMIGIVLSYFHIGVGIAVFLLVYNLPHLYVRLVGLFKGYELGINVIKHVTANKYKKLAANLTMLGAFLAGFMIIALPFWMENDIGRHFVAAGSGALLMMGLLKLKLSVPFAMIILSLYSVLLGILL